MERKEKRSQGQKNTGHVKAYYEHTNVFVGLIDGPKRSLP